MILSTESPHKVICDVTSVGLSLNSNYIGLSLHTPSLVLMCIIICSAYRI